MTDIDDNEFEELPEREPAWLRLDRATVNRKKLLAAGYLPIPVNGKAPAIQGWSDIRATDARQHASYRYRCPRFRRSQ
jgi:hypothetical protein